MRRKILLLIFGIFSLTGASSTLLLIWGQVEAIHQALELQFKQASLTLQQNQNNLLEQGKMLLRAVQKGGDPLTESNALGLPLIGLEINGERRFGPPLPPKEGLAQIGSKQAWVFKFPQKSGKIAFAAEKILPRLQLSVSGLWLKNQWMAPLKNKKQNQEAALLLKGVQPGEVLTLPASGWGSMLKSLLGHRQTIYLALPLGQGYLIIPAEKEALEAGAKQFLWISITVGTLFGLFALVVLNRMLSRWVLSPIEQVDQALFRIRAGELSARLNFTRADVIGNLARNLDDFVESIEAEVLPSFHRLA